MTLKNIFARKFCLKGHSFYHKSLIQGRAVKIFTEAKYMKTDIFVCQLEEGYVG